MLDSLEYLFREIDAHLGSGCNSGRVEVRSTTVVELAKKSPNGRTGLRIKIDRRASLEITAEQTRF